MHGPRKIHETDVKSRSHGGAESLRLSFADAPASIAPIGALRDATVAVLIAPLSGLIGSAALLTSPQRPRASLNVPECYTLGYSSPIGRVAGERFFQGSSNPGEEAQHGQFVMGVRTDCAASSRAGQRGASPRTLR